MHHQIQTLESILGDIPIAHEVARTAIVESIRQVNLAIDYLRYTKLILTGLDHQFDATVASLVAQ
jgi:hypothetical protein